jgi:hypothetical protein
MGHIQDLVARLKEALNCVDGEYHRTSIRLAITEIEHLATRTAVQGAISGYYETLIKLAESKPIPYGIGGVE